MVDNYGVCFADLSKSLCLVNTLTFNPQLSIANFPYKPIHPLHILLRGVFFMCRQNQLFGFCLMAFGLGVLVGLGLEGGFLCWCLGIGLILAGICGLGKK